MSHASLFAPISSLTPSCLTSTFCPPHRSAQVQLSCDFLGRHRESFTSTWWLSLFFFSCFSLKMGKTLPMEEKRILVVQVWSVTIVQRTLPARVKTDQSMTSGPSLMYSMEKLPFGRNTQDIFKHDGDQFDKPPPFCTIQCWSGPTEKTP